ncbi:MAG: lysophospholipid acyltransferase family protein [Candidatus Omnitrophica bacterium]|nr:lysophospholipid acyltransferase family protein [Candidatus Omnitrophota bacterium]
MSFRGITKASRRLLGWIAIIFCSLIIRFIPYSLISCLSKIIAELGYYLAGRHRKIALESLKIAFGKEKGFSEIKRIAKKSFRLMAQNGLEFLFLIQNPKLIRSKVSFEGKEHLEKALAKGRGVILLTAHFGNFPLMMARLSLEGYPIYGIMRRMRDERTEKLFYSKRTHLGINTIYSKPAKICVEKSLRVLRENKLLCIQLDQNFGTAGIFVDFFKRKAATATGPVVLALRTKASILPCFILHNQDSTYRIVFEPEYKIKLTKNFSEAVLINIQELTSLIESYIRRYPEEWSWIHRRWKTQPSQ